MQKMSRAKSLSKFEKYVKSSIKATQAQLVHLTTGVLYSCFYCKVNFSCEGSIFVHLTTLKHLGLPNKAFQKNPKYECNICGTDLALENITKHLCIEKAYKNYYGIIKHVDEFGCPNMCLLCRGAMFETPAHLNLHVLIKHRWSDFETDLGKKNNEKKLKIAGLKCPLCLASFRTNNLHVLHLHAFEAHLPDISIPLLKTFSSFRRAKYGSENDMKQWLTKQLFSCHFPHTTVKRFPMTKSYEINRTLPDFNSINCNYTFNTMINLTSHLCSHHFLDESILKRNKNNRKSIDFRTVEYELRINLIQKELDLKKRNLIDRNILIKTIPASKYCFECFTLFKSNIKLQIHYLVVHSNYEWNICGLCNYDCKKTLSMTEDVSASPSKTNSLLWNAFKIHEQSHTQFFDKLFKNPEIEITNDLMPDLSETLKLTLKPFNSIVSINYVETLTSIVQKSNFTEEQKKFFTLLGKENKNAQTDLVIAESLNNAI